MSSRQQGDVLFYRFVVSQMWTARLLQVVGSLFAGAVVPSSRGNVCKWFVMVDGFR